MARKLTFTLLAALLISVAAFAKPDIPAPPTKKTTLNLSADTNWGKLTHAGNVISIKGHPQWDAEGYVRADGSVYLLWTLKSTNAPAPAVYKIVDRELRGSWGYSHEVRVEPDGSLSGETRPDRVTPVEPEVPGF